MPILSVNPSIYQYLETHNIVSSNDTVTNKDGTLSSYNGNPAYLLGKNTTAPIPTPEPIGNTDHTYDKGYITLSIPATSLTNFTGSVNPIIEVRANIAVNFVSTEQWLFNVYKQVGSNSPILINTYYFGTIIAATGGGDLLIPTSGVSKDDLAQGVKLIFTDFKYPNLGEQNNVGLKINTNVSMSIRYNELVSTSCSMGGEFGWYNKIQTVNDDKGNSVTSIIDYNSVDCGYKPSGFKFGEFCGTGSDIYSLMGTFSTGIYDSAGQFSTYTQVIERNKESCGYIPRGRLISTSCSVAGDGFREHEMIGNYSEGVYDASGTFSTYQEVIEPRSIWCGYIPTGNVTFASNASDAVFDVAGKGSFAANQTVNNWLPDTYSYTVTAKGYTPKSGSFNLTPSGAVVSVSFTGADKPAFFKLVGTPELVKVSEMVNGNKVFLGFTSSTNPLEVEEGQYNLVIEKEGYTSQTVNATGVLGQTVQVNYSLQAVAKASTKEVYYEAVLTDPVTYKVVDRVTLKDAFNFSYSEKFREMSDFSFTVPLSIGEFKDITSSSSGELGVLLYVNGMARVQGIIQNKSPSGDGYTNVSCVEILGGLNDAWNGRLDLNNIEFEYRPPESGIDGGADKETQYEYWNYGFGKSNFFYTDDVFQIVNLTEDSEGVSSPEGASNTVKMRPFRARKISSYTAHVKGLGKPFTNFSFNGAGLLEFTFDGDKFRITNQFSTVASSATVEKYIIGGGQQDIYESLSNADVYYTFSYEELNSTSIKVSAEVKILYLGTIKTYTINPVTVSASSPALTIPSFTLPSGAGISKFYVEARDKVTLLDWLNKVGAGQTGYHSVKVRFEQGLGSKVSGTALRLTYEDPSRWSVVKDILDLAGAVTTEYVGVLDGVPTYLVHDTDALPKLRKFYATGEVFNVSYQQDLANVFNVLTVRASDSVKGYNQTTNNVITITIAPSSERPNRLGRLAHNIVGAEGIRDIETLTKYALAVYEEHSSPSEPIEFESYTDNEWLNALTGQTIMMYGLPDGNIVTEKIVNMSFNEQTGLTRIELGETISMSEAIQRTLKANAF